MAKIKAGKPDQNRKAGDEGLKYTPAADVIGGQPCNDPKPGLQPDKGVTGTPTLPPVKK
jgi:hypothetical protein